MAFHREDPYQLFQPAAADDPAHSDIVIDRRDGVLSIDLLDDPDD